MKTEETLLIMMVAMVVCIFIALFIRQEVILSDLALFRENVRILAETDFDIKPAILKLLGEM